MELSVAAHRAFRAIAASTPQRTAVVCGDERVSYGALRQRADAVTRALADDGVQPGDRVLVLLENGVDYVAALHGVFAAGAVCVPVSPLAKSDKLAFLARDTRARVLLTQASLAAAWRPVLSAGTTLAACHVAGAAHDDTPVRPWPAADAAAAAVVPAAVEGDAIALLVYTSGTTGVPKGVMLTHRNVESALASIQGYLGFTPDDVVALTLPAVFSYGLSNLLLALSVGATVVLDRWAAFPVKLAGLLASERVTVLPGVPTLFASLLGLAELARHDLSSLRIVTNAAAALPQPHLQRLRALLPQARLYSMYGLTECMRASYLPPEQLDHRPASVGRGMPGQVHWLVDDAGRRLPHGSTGELVVQGPHVMQGYWERPLETQQKLSADPATGQRVLRTGDIFRSDDEGWLHFVARRDDIIKTRGEKVAPREVENAIYQLEAVTGCAVVGVADEALGQAVKAYVTLQSGCGLRERDIVKHCLARLENYMAPKYVEIVDELPRTESGKIRHASLR
jgi:amino acid adenylation domain-containing protein